ncbi:MAG TPA: hypothetical protein VNN10_11640 [Dehalococcoidia bacterium]|nr:hypothetical protein [Dehalococcoidia bacterium]
MAVRPEVLAQLARMLGDDALRAGSDEEVGAALGRSFDALVDALVAETADSDDVFDRASALRYANLRLSELSLVVPPDLIERLREELTARLSAW